MLKERSQSQLPHIAWLHLCEIVIGNLIRIGYLLETGVVS